MRRLGSSWRPLFLDVAEEARDCVARAQAALADEHLAGAFRQMLGIYDLLVTPLDAWAARIAATVAKDESAKDEGLSAAIGLLGLWNELLDIDVERDSIEELLVWHAAQADSRETNPKEWSIAIDEAARAAQKSQLESTLLAAPPPRSHFWRRLSRRAAGPLGDRAHISVRRGATIVFERSPPDENAAAGAQLASTDLGAFRDGDRLTLQWQMPLPGQVAVLHAVGDDQQADLSLLMPQHESELVNRRYHEVVEVVGELSAVPNCREHGLVVIWGPELLPAQWSSEVVVRRRVPPESRVWLYRYTIDSPAEPSSDTSGDTSGDAPAP